MAKKALGKQKAVTLPDMRHRQLVLAAGGGDGVAEEAGDGHGACAAGNGRDMPCDFGYLGKINISGDFAVIHAVDADVNHNRAGLYPVFLYKVRFADGDDQSGPPGGSIWMTSAP